jgi:hypothetical protein
MIADRKLPHDLEKLFQADLSYWLDNCKSRDDLMAMARELWRAGRASKIAAEQVAPEANHEASRCSD